MTERKRIVLVWNYSVIEPLFALYLGGLIRDRQHAWTGVPIRKYDYAPLFERVESFGATDVGFNVYSGNHVRVFAVADELRKRGVRVHIGGPHATYSAERCAEHADWVYKGQSFDSFGAFLDDELPRFVAESLLHREHARWLDEAIAAHKLAREISPQRTLDAAEMAPIEAEAAARIEERAAAPEVRDQVSRALASRVLFRDYLSDTFPRPDRETFYRDNPDFALNPIKNTICGEGCPFACTYCYNVAWNSPEMYGRFQRRVLRRIDDVIDELRELANYGTKLIYVQDDVFGFELSWLREFMPRYRDEVGIPFHAQLRLELATGPTGIERLHWMKLGGCTGVTVAIENGSYDVRKDVLDRPMKDAHILEGCKNIRAAGMTLRTEQILGVPTMSTRAGGSVLDIDLLTLRLNVLIQPDIAWTAILAPYGGTELGALCARLGLYSAERLATNDDVSDSFFDESVLDYSPLYRLQVRALQRLFSTLAHVDWGDRIAARFLDGLGRHPTETVEGFLVLAKDIAKHTKAALYDAELYRMKDERALLATGTRSPATGGISGTNTKSRDELLAQLDTATARLSVDDLARLPWTEEQSAVFTALRPLWARMPHGGAIALQFLEGFPENDESCRHAFLELASELGAIAREAFAEAAMDRTAEIARLTTDERARLGAKRSLLAPPEVASGAPSVPRA